MLLKKGEKVNMENAVVYARFSSKNQTENSIEAQVTAAKNFAKGKYNIIKVYADRAKTGTNDQREAFQEMLRDSSSHDFSVVIVWKVDRFGRNREEITMNKYRLKKNGVRLEYVAENISSSSEGVILESVLEGFAEYYSKQLSQNVKRGIRERASKGKYIGKLPYGYRLNDGKVEICEVEAKKIKDVFKMYIEGYSFNEIARSLHLQNYNIKVYLTNIQYTGVYNKCGMNLTGIFPRIIDDATFKIANEHYNKRRKYCKKPDKYLLSGKVFCTCGAKFVGNGGGGYKYSYYRPTCNCKAKRIRREILEDFCMDHIQNIIESDEIIDKVFEKVNKSKNVNYSSKISTLKQKRQNIISAVEDGLPYSEIRDRINEIDAEIKDLESKNLTKVTLSKEEVKDFLKRVKSLNSNRALIENIIDRVTVDPATGLFEVTYAHIWHK